MLTVTINKIAGESTRERRRTDQKDVGETTFGQLDAGETTRGVGEVVVGELDVGELDVGELTRVRNDGIPHLFEFHPFSNSSLL